MNQTPPKLIFLVVIAIALLATICVSTLCAGLFMHTYADPAILTSIISLTSALVGYLSGILSSPRSQAPGSQTTTTTTTPQEPPAVQPVAPYV